MDISKNQSIRNWQIGDANWDNVYAFYPIWIRHYLTDNEFAFMCFFIEKCTRAKVYDGVIKIITRAFECSNEDVMKGLNASRRTVTRYCTILEKLGLLKAKRGLYCKTYTVNWQLIQAVNECFGKKNVEFWNSVRNKYGDSNIEYVVNKIINWRNE